MKDYFQILGVTPASSEEEIRKSYRSLAMQYHPDRNPDSPGAEEKFKDIAEAYGVLTDPVKRQQYEAARAMGGNHYQAGSEGGFNYSQEDILRDLFQDPRFQQLFQGLLNEFQRNGFRASQHFVRQSFFGGRGRLFIGGLFFFGSVAGPALLGAARKSLPGKKTLIKSIGSAVGTLLSGPKQQDVKKKVDQETQKLLHTTYDTPLTAEELREGKMVKIMTPGPDGGEVLKVTIPPGSRAGQKLRLRGKGIEGSQGRGDLFLCLVEKQPSAEPS